MFSPRLNEKRLCLLERKTPPLLTITSNLARDKGTETESQVTFFIERKTRTQLHYVESKHQTQQSINDKADYSHWTTNTTN